MNSNKKITIEKRCRKQDEISQNFAHLKGMILEMVKIKKSTSGITLIALAITITVLAILIGISIYSGKETIQQAKLEELKTNMLLIQAKSKEYVEKANFKMGINPDEKTTEEKQKIRNEVYGAENEEGAQQKKAKKISNKGKFY